MPNTAWAKVTASIFVNGVLHLAGEVAQVNLDELGVEQLGGGFTPGLEPISKAEADAVIAALDAPKLSSPVDGVPAGTVQSGTGRLIYPGAELIGDRI